MAGCRSVHKLAGRLRALCAAEGGDEWFRVSHNELVTTQKTCFDSYSDRKPITGVMVLARAMAPLPKRRRMASTLVSSFAFFSSI